jgi:hypothetical protein
VNVRLRKLTKDYGDFDIIQQEIENASTTNEGVEQEYRQRELLNEKTFVTEKNQATAQTSSLSENIYNSHIHALHRIRQDYLKLLTDIHHSHDQVE